MREPRFISSADMDGTTTMKVLSGFAAFALLALGGSISGVSAAEGSEAVASAASAADEDAALPRFVPLEQSPAIVAPELATVQPIPEDPDAAAGDADEIGDGMASWYGRKFAGRRTASGERFDPGGYTAAHRTLPFGSRVRVTNAAGKSVVVRINDRGPFHGGRVIDLSQAAAAELGLVRAGSGRVSLALID